MDLRESMLAAADDAPLETSTVDLNEIVRNERRARAGRRLGAGSVALAAAVAVALTIPALGGGRNVATNDAGTQAAIGPPPAATSAAAPASPSGTTRLRLTAAEMSGMLGGGSGSGGFWLIAYRDLSVHLAADGNPCTLAPGATAGKGRAPVPEDTCTKVERAGRTVWVRRWGYSPDLRPWMSPETMVVEFFVRKGDRAMMLGISNTYPMKGSKPRAALGGSFDISDEELAKFALTVDFPPD